MRKILSRFHTWLGLFCAPFFVLIGLSSVHFNHEFDFVERGGTVVNWERDISVADSEDNAELGRRIRDELDLMGTVSGWQAQRGDDGGFSVPVYHPGKRYVISTGPQRDLARVEETRHGLLFVIAGLHGAHTIPNSSLGWVWTWYTNICTLFGFFAVASGLYFWSRRRNFRAAGWILLCTVTGGGILLMAWIRIWG